MKDSFEYSYSPKADTGRAAILIVMCIFTCVVFGLMSADAEVILSPVFGIISSFFLLLTVIFSVRLLGIRYAYRIVMDRDGEGDLMIYELRGFFGKYSDTKSARAVCRVSLYDIEQVVCLEKSKKGKKEIRALKKQIGKEKAKLYNYCSDIFLREYSILKLSDGEDSFYVKFSPDEKILDLISR